MLDLNIGVMLIEAGIFLVTMIFLKMWLFDPLVRFMDERDAKLSESLRMIDYNEEDTKKLEKEIEEILAKARKEAKEIREEAKLKAIKDAEEMKAKALASIEEAKKTLEKEIEKEKNSILQTLNVSKNEIKKAMENKIRNAA
jgi:F-type H+-transporting ATPase subunit b